MKTSFIKIKTIKNKVVLINIDDISTVYNIEHLKKDATCIIIKGRDCDNDDISFYTYTSLKDIQDFLNSVARVFEFVEQKK